MRRIGSVLLGTLLLGGVCTATVGTAAAAERRADVKLTAAPSTVEVPAGKPGTVKLTYSNIGNVPKVGSSITAPIPKGLTATARPAPGWTCHIDDWPSLVCDTDGKLDPGAVVVPAEVDLSAAAPVSAGVEFGTLGFYRDPTENPADNYSTVQVRVS
ncbi:hypothetical protein [Amycolatopsis sp. CA-230715]|uniref:hypothetical protein n=1 Tax=Amycolatopsis sp. CA-230715 TaxID=2745196 RepID=UPI001C010905|nr:hypothetical protein [Amycolatopsis sp. CA-230715]QWF83005.1 hypothetical protein HUW46_06444 [Amycolatopsis sp. CA-230715]